MEEKKNKVVLPIILTLVAGLAVGTGTGYLIFRNTMGLTEEEKKTKRDERITTFGTLVHKTIEDRIKGIEEDYSSFFNGEKGQKEAINEA